MPVMTFCQYDDTFARLNPFCNTAINKTPNAVPTTPPTPPLKLVPPSNTAAATSNSVPVPIVGAAEANRPVSMMPAIAANMALIA